ncbi:MAG: VanZ family protein [Gemmatimonadota bacterium]
MVAAVAWLGVIGWCTLQSNPGAAIAVARLPWYCVVCGDGGAADVALNILLFAPLGFILAALRWRKWGAVLFALLLSISIEVFQSKMLIGRDACVGDVLSNTTGALAGWLGYFGMSALARPSLQFARAGTALLLAVTTGLWFASGAALQPSLTNDAQWVGQPTAPGRGPQPFPGTMLSATFDGIEMIEGEVPQAPWRDSIVVELHTTRKTGELFQRGIVLLRVVDMNDAMELAIDERGDDAWLMLRLRGADWLLHNPRWQVSHAMQVNGGEPWRFRWSWLRDRFSIVNEPLAGPPAPPIAVPLSIGLGWAFVHPFVNTIGTNRLLWTTAWLGFWFGLLGWLAGALSPRVTIGTGIVSLAIYAGVSHWWGMPVQLTEMAAAAGAFAVLGIVSWARTRLSS